MSGNERGRAKNALFGFFVWVLSPFFFPFSFAPLLRGTETKGKGVQYSYKERKQNKEHKETKEKKVKGIIRWWRATMQMRCDVMRCDVITCIVMFGGFFFLFLLCIVIFSPPLSPLFLAFFYHRLYLLTHLQLSPHFPFPTTPHHSSLTSFLPMFFLTPSFFLCIYFLSFKEKVKKKKPSKKKSKKRTNM